MLRGLLHEIVRRRLWPIPLLALLIAVAAPLLFLKSSSGEAPATAPGSEATVDVSAVDSLPVRARRLLETKSAPGHEAKKRPKPADPFQGPKPSHTGASTTTPSSPSTSSSATGSATASSSGSAAEQQPVPVVITDANGKTKTTTDTKTSTSTNSATATSSGSDPSYVAIDVRFAPKATGPVLHAVPRLRPLMAQGRVIASFVRYSPKRNKAVFAVSPTTWVRGSVGCRHVDGKCRFVDLAAGKHVWLSIVGPGNTAITRRLSIVRIHTAAGKEPRPPLAGSCLLRKLQTSALGDPAVLSDACD